MIKFFSTILFVLVYGPIILKINPPIKETNFGGSNHKNLHIKKTIINSRTNLVLIKILEENIELLNEIDKLIKISFLKKNEKILLSCDKEQISRAFFNLIKNSIESIQQKTEKTSNFEKKISIEISQNNDHINLTIIDNGIGFDQVKNNIKDILNPYFTTKKKGTGLGLSIVNKIISDHNGELKFYPITDGAKIEINFLSNGN